MHAREGGVPVVKSSIQFEPAKPDGQRAGHKIRLVGTRRFDGGLQGRDLGFGTGCVL